ncbi:MAG: hypothetical protein EP298_09870 [Gammaproteobacteria bacterium]|nr:MAG: hypothetical protein EP298_09870 [Gammaproteobacteria bacterium]UTW41549.1 hypothetical protein KFE69_08505 [bacterium SCSIO 12844]
MKYIISSILAGLLSINSFASAPKGSGIPIYDLSSDLVCSSTNKCQSANWYKNILQQHASSTNLKYIYPNYPYINYFVNVDPTQYKDQMNDMVDNNCSQTSPVFISYNVYPQGSSQCTATGQAANNAYNLSKQFNVLPTFSFNTVLVDYANQCYDKSGQFNANNCYIPCNTKNTNPLFNQDKLPAECVYDPNDPAYDKMHITNATTLNKLIYQTGQLVGMIITNDTSADGASFDIEGPPFISTLAEQFYSGLIDQINNKFIGIWRGVNIFGRDQQDFTTLEKIANNNGFIILSMYDIGPTDAVTVIPDKGIQLSYNHSGGLEVANPANWYAGNPVSSITPILQPGQGGFSNYSNFEITLFGVPVYWNNVTVLDCHPKELMMSKNAQQKYTWMTGFNGCTGSVSFMQRFALNNQLNIPFQVGIPAVSSTTEWVNAIAWGMEEKLNQLELHTSFAGSTWITSQVCPKNMNINGVQCQQFSFKKDYQSTNNSQADFLSSGYDGALNILSNYLKGTQTSKHSPSFKQNQTTQATLKLLQQYMRKNFMGLYIYGLKPSDFDKTNCEYQINNRGASICFANYPNNNLNNQIPDDVWAVIKSFTENAL